MTVTFTNASTGTVTSQVWDFGDGSTSTLDSPVHVYGSSGTFTVSLHAFGPCGDDTSTLVGYVQAVDPPVADFTGSPLSVTAPAAVNFVDASTGQVTSRSWNFGDGNLSTALNPSNTYTAPGTYTVVLTATGPYSSSVRTRTAYVSVGQLIDQFTTTQAAPLGTRSCQPGPGTLIFTDSANVMSIAGGRLVVNGSPAATDGFITSASYARTAGLACFIQAPASGGVTLVGAGNDRMGFVSTNSISGTESASFSYSGSATGDIVVQPINQSIKGAFGNNAFIGDLAMVLRGTGAFVLARTSGDAVWRLAYILATGVATPLWVRYKLSANSYNISLDNASVVNLPAPWTTDTGIAQSTASLNAGDTFTTSSGDSVLECTRTIVTSDVWDLQLRRASDNDCWIVRLTQANSGTGTAVQLFEKVGGVETQRAAATQTLTNGVSYRVVITADTQSIAVYINDVQKMFYTSAATQQATTGGKTTLAATVNVYPRYLSGSAETAIDQAYPYGNPGFATVYADNTLAADSTSYNPTTRQGVGGVSRAYKTLGSALAAVSSGGTVILRGGTFSETNAAQRCYNIATTCTLTVAAGELAVLTYDPNNVPLQDPTNVGQIINVPGSVNATIDGTPGQGAFGIKVVGTLALGATVGAAQNDSICIQVLGGATIRGTELTAWGHAGIKTTTTLTGALLIERNYIHDGGLGQLDHGLYLHADSVSGRNTVRYNWITGCTGYGIHMYSTPINHDVYANTVWNCGLTANQGVGGAYVGGSGHNFVNNTIVLNGANALAGYGNLVMGSLAGDGNSLIANNILRGTKMDVNTGAGPQAGANTWKNNDVHLQTGSGYDGSTAVDLDPLFVSASPAVAADFRLQAGSPVRNIGYAVGSPYNVLLDPASPSAPVAQAGTSSNLGAWA